MSVRRRRLGSRQLAESVRQVRGSWNAARTSRSIVTAALLTLTVLLVPTRQQALARECSHDGYARLTVLLAPGEEVTIAVGTGNRIVVGGEECATIGGGERPATSILVEVADGADDETVVVSQAGPGGPFPQGFPIDVNLGEGAADRVLVGGDDASETYWFNGSGMVAPLAIFPSGVERFELEAGGGDDTIDASGTDVDTGSFALPVTIRGGPGDDTLIGGPRDDRILGEDGDDTLDGGPGSDRLIGGEGTDLCVLGDLEMPCDPSIRVEPSAVLAGETLTVSGDGWYPENGAVELSLGFPDGASPQRLEEVVPDDGWTIETTLDAPSPDGTYSIGACQLCRESDPQSVTGTFTVRPSAAGPTVSVRPATVAAGEDVVVFGEGWDPGIGPVTLSLGPADARAGEPFATVPPGPDGSFEEPYRGPELGEGPYLVTACQRCGESDPIEATATFTIEARAPLSARLELAPRQAGPGDPIRVMGAGWDPDGGRVQISVGASTDEPDVTVPVERDGTFGTELNVPDLPGGSYTVLACQRCQEPDAVRATTTLTVSAAAPAWWWWVVAGVALLTAAIGALVARRVRGRRPPPTGEVHASLIPSEPEVHLVAQPDEAPRHTVRLTTRGDPGVQQIREGSPR